MSIKCFKLCGPLRRLCQGLTLGPTTDFCHQLFFAMGTESLVAFTKARPEEFLHDFARIEEDMADIPVDNREES